MKIFHLVSILSAILVLFLLPLSETTGQQRGVLSATSTCASSAPSSGAYTVTVCFTNPANGSALSGDATVTAAVSVSGGTSPGVQRVVFYLDGGYLLTDYQTAYTFTLPTNKWVDGSHSISAEARMRDGFIAKRASIPVTFSNGVTTTPVNNNHFQPSSGRASTNGAPFIVAAAGDGGSGEANAGKVSDLINSANPNLFLYLGDVYEQGSPAEFYNWYGTSSTFLGRLRSITDPTIGNHEYLMQQTAPGYFDYWNNVPNYYSYNAGGWHFISLNSNGKYVPTGATSAQFNWLKQDLAALPANQCTIVYYHHPLYDIGPEDPATGMAAIWSLMAQYGVDIVLNGHDHDYQRWKPLNGSGQPSSNGITEFVAGGGGHSLQKFAKSDSRVAYSNDKNPTVYGALFLQLNAQGANFNYRNIGGTIIDSGVVPCVPASPDNQAPSTPGGFSATASSSTRVDLRWTASSDNVGVAGYTIYRNGSALKSVRAVQLTYSDTSVTAATSYSYSVDAYDPAGNHSLATAPILVTTPSTTTSSTSTPTPTSAFTATPSPTLGTSAVFRPDADTYVSSGSPSTNYGASTVLRADSSPDQHSYLRFTVQGLNGRTITRARLMVYANSSTSAGIRVLAVSNNTWGELAMTYNNAPALGSVLASSGAVATGTWVTLDVSSQVSAQGTFSFGVNTSGSTAVSLASRETGATAPQLIVDLGP